MDLGLNHYRPGGICLQGESGVIICIYCEHIESHWTRQLPYGGQWPQIHQYLGWANFTKSAQSGLNSSLDFTFYLNESKVTLLLYRAIEG